MVIINTLFIGAVVLALIAVPVSPLFALSIVSLTMTNGILHIIMGIRKKKYFPGLITACLLYIPLGILSFVSFPISTGAKILSFLLGLAWHSVPFIILLFKRKRNRHKEAD